MGKGIYLAVYDPTWPDMFVLERERLKVHLGDYAEHLEHIGSTSIPGISSKPVLDMILGVPGLDEDFARVCPILEQADYIFKFEYLDRMPERRFFYRLNEEGASTHHLHMVQWRGADWLRHLAFRDYLRAHEEVAHAYETIKHGLAKEYSDPAQYSDAKTPWIRAVEQQALEWWAGV